MEGGCWRKHDRKIQYIKWGMDITKNKNQISKIMALMSVFIFFVSAPAVAANTGEKSNGAVWIALGAVALGLMTIAISLYTNRMAKRKKEMEEK